MQSLNDWATPRCVDSSRIISRHTAVLGNRPDGRERSARSITISAKRATIGKGTLRPTPCRFLPQHRFLVSSVLQYGTVQIKATVGCASVGMLVHTSHHC